MTKPKSVTRPTMSKKKPAEFSKVIKWDSFVNVCLELTIEAYQKMKTEINPSVEWEEDQFTIKLGDDYLRPIAYRHPLNVRIIVRSRVHTEAMADGKITAKYAKEIDLKLLGPWENYHKQYFAWECKRIGDPKGGESDDTLISKYISQGIRRFIDEEYSKDLDNAGMLGYVLSGTAADIVKALNSSMSDPHSKQKLNSSHHLDLLSPPITGFNDIYISQHTRTAKPIRLHHLFLTFNFATPTPTC